MNIVVCGGGEIALQLLKLLVEKNYIIQFIDDNKDMVQKVSETIDCMASLGDASSPSFLSNIDIDDVDVVISLYDCDDKNLLISKICGDIFNINTKIVKLNTNKFNEKEELDAFIKKEMNVDVIIDENRLISKYLEKIIKYNGINDFNLFIEGDNRIFYGSVEVKENSSILEKFIYKIYNSYPKLGLRIIAISHNGEYLEIDDETKIHNGDMVYFCCPEENLEKALIIFGHFALIDSDIIINSVNENTAYISNYMERFGLGFKFIEKDASVINNFYNKIGNTMCLNGDVLHEEIQREASIFENDLFISASNDDNLNIISSHAVQKINGCRSIAFVTNDFYKQIKNDLMVDVIINKYSILIDEIYNKIKLDYFKEAFSVGNSNDKIIKTKAGNDSSVIGRNIYDIGLKEKSFDIHYLIRDNKVSVPSKDEIINVDDVLIMRIGNKNSKIVEKLFMPI